MAQTMQYLTTRLARLYNKKSSALSQLNMSHVSHLTVFAFLALLIVFMPGCAAPQQEVKKRYFWPPLPDRPKLEFIGAYMGPYDLPRSPFQEFMESLVGKTENISMTRPWGVASDGEGKVYVANTGGVNVIRFDFVSNKVTVLSAEGLFKAPIGIGLDKDGNIYVSDSMNNRVYSFNKNEEPLGVFGSEGELIRPTGIAISDKLKRLYVVNSQKHAVSVFDLTGKKHLFDIGKRGNGDGNFNYPVDVAIDSQDNIVVSDSMNARVQILDKDGKFLSKFGNRGDSLTDFQLIKGLAVDKNDLIYVADGRADKILVFDKNGEALLVVGGPAAIGKVGKLSPGGFFLPQDIMIDKNGRMYVVDSMNGRIQVIQIIDDQWLKEHPIL